MLRVVTGDSSVIEAAGLGGDRGGLAGIFAFLFYQFYSQIPTRTGVLWSDTKVKSILTRKK